jgi:2-polyprenyl-3-methyl-5-hydroxy-6-metoxy-1,4-benzoquinol methylase
VKALTAPSDCIVCGNPGKKVLLDLRSLKILPQAMYLVKCRQCGFEYIDPHPTGNVVEELYNEGYFRDGYLNHENRRIQQCELLHKRLLERGIMDSSHSLNVLDVGAGVGYFLRLARDTCGANVYGVEPSSFARTYARRKFGIDCFSDISGVEDTTFDVITFWDVIGHVDSPQDYLAFCRDHIKDSGYLVIKFPNFGSCWHRFNFLFSKWQHVNAIHAPTIVWRFSKSTISRFLERFGFRIEATETVTQPQLNGFLSRKRRAARCFTTIVDEVTSNRQEIIIYARKK